VVEAALSAARRRRGVVAVWAVLGVLLVGVAALELADRRRPASDERIDTRQLVPVPIVELGAVEIADGGRLHRFERDGAGTWFYHGVHAATQVAHTHGADPALAERIEQVLAAFGRTRIERRFTLDREAGSYGLTPPALVVLLYRPRASQPLAQYAVGAVAPDTASRYVLLVGSHDVVTIPNFQVENLQALVTAASATAPVTAGGR
jgi:hypothetical protein